MFTTRFAVISVARVSLPFVSDHHLLVFTVYSLFPTNPVHTPISFTHTIVNPTQMFQRINLFPTDHQSTDTIFLQNDYLFWLVQQIG